MPRSSSSTLSRPRLHPRQPQDIWLWSERAQVWQANARMALRKFVENGERFDIVFADPPFTDLEEC